MLGTLGGTYSTAFDVNSAGQIVGYSYTSRSSVPKAFVLANGTMTNLNSITNVGSRILQHANAINDNGDIVGFMQVPIRRNNHEQRGFLLRPITP